MSEQQLDEFSLLKRVLEVYDQKQVAEKLNGSSGDNWNREAINRWVNGKASPKLSHYEYIILESMLPQPPESDSHDFTFIDLFAGIGGIRKGFEDAGGKCLFTSEWNKYSVRTYKANHYNDPDKHTFNEDIREVTLSDDENVSEEQAYRHIDSVVPHHDVLLAGFPCQPFSIAGVSKKNALGRAHGFECQTQGTLFFDVARIIKAKQPAAFVLENVKNLRSHDKGKTFKIIMETLDELGYEVADMEAAGADDPKIIDGKHFLPQHRERVVLVGFRRDLDVHQGFTLRDISKYHPETAVTLSDILTPEEDVDSRYILTPKLWAYLYNYAKKHKAKGNGFGYGLVSDKDITRTLSARYYKDGSEILIDRGWDFVKGFEDGENLERRPRRLTPRECARLMGFDKKGEAEFKIPVSDTQSYKQFGNSVVVPVFAAVAGLMKDRIMESKTKSIQQSLFDVA
ncbi:DNA (cytosine-5-)-methyltransferase [Amphritea sp.]|uniref:DNA (cytosine-5-)-methyltransferase n=1 Tax=Amphritea sp. TaxID=1872502 RepID=UPI0025C60863|nr:DNA (cytosine-5-)-methyltransferase [Amphritea sp.]